MLSYNKRVANIANRIDKRIKMREETKILEGKKLRRDIVILLISLTLAILNVVPLFPSTFLEEGEKLFLENKPRESAPLLEAALNEDPTNERIYLYLGIVYDQLGELDKSIKIMRRGLNVATTIKDILYFNIGNNLFTKGDYALAEDMYSEAIKINKEIPEAYLNRANSRLKQNKYREAVADYTLYLRLKPDTEQRTEIEKLISILNNLIIAEEKKKAEELAKQKALMNDVLNSLKNASEDTKNLSAGSEKIQKEYEDVDIQD